MHRNQPMHGRKSSNNCGKQAHQSHHLPAKTDSPTISACHPEATTKHEVKSNFKTRINPPISSHKPVLEGVANIWPRLCLQRPQRVCASTMPSNI
jgi:hypothetical protein